MHLCTPKTICSVLVVVPQAYTIPWFHRFLLVSRKFSPDTLACSVPCRCLIMLWALIFSGCRLGLGPMVVAQMR